MTEHFFTYHKGTLEEFKRITFNKIITALKRITIFTTTCGQDTTKTHLIFECEPIIEK